MSGEKVGQELPAANRPKCTKCHRPVKGQLRPGPHARCTAAPLLPSPEKGRGPDVAAQVKLVTLAKGDQRTEDCACCGGAMTPTHQCDVIAASDG